FPEDPEDDAVGPEPLRSLHVGSQGLELGRRVAKIAATRPDHDVQIDLDPLPDALDGSRAGGDSPLEQARAQLHSPCPAFLGGYRPLDGFDATLESEGPRFVPAHFAGFNVHA